MTTLAELLEQQSNTRMGKMPSITPSVAPSTSVPEPPAATGGMESILPLLLGGQGGGGMQGGMQGTGGSSNWENVARRMATNRYGYSPQDFNKLDSIISRESNWDPNALNEGSGAYGIPQILPSAHPNTHLQGNPRGQIKWLLNYIDQRYGGIDQALSFKDSHGWY